ncbi:hypothetical protein BH11ACT5_BH11ACT5_17570 [soil metagenome]
MSASSVGRRTAANILIQSQSDAQIVEMWNGLGVAPDQLPAVVLPELRMRPGIAVTVSPTADPTAAASTTPSTAVPKALDAIVGAIPAEGVAVYVGIYGLVLAAVGGKAEVWAAFVVLLIAVAINVFAILWGARAAYLITPEADKPKTRKALAWRSVAFTVLLLIYVMAMPLNPFNLLGVDLIWGGIAAVVAATVVGITKKP